MFKMDDLEFRLMDEAHCHGYGGDADNMRALLRLIVGPYLEQKNAGKIRELSGYITIERGTKAP